MKERKKERNGKLIRFTRYERSCEGKAGAMYAVWFNLSLL